jgi:tetratricopeptide (TPR) repeat protein
MRNFKGALADLDKVVRSGRRPALALLSRAKLHHVMGRLDLSIADYRAAIALQPKRAVTVFGLAFVWRDHGRLDKAFETLNRALLIHPRYCEAYTVRAAIRQFRGDLAGALVDADKAVALDPDYLYAYTRRGQVLLAQGNKKSAEADFDMAVTLKPKHAWRWGARAAFLHYASGQYQKARADLRQALKLATRKSQSEQHVFRALLIAATLRAGRTTRARILLREAVPSHLDTMEWAGIRFLKGELTAAALTQMIQGTLYWLDYLRFLQGLKAELDGDHVAARTAYSAVMTRYRWSTLWYAIASHHQRWMDTLIHME